mgnify:CR=1 FL=1
MHRDVLQKPPCKPYWHVHICGSPAIRLRPILEDALIWARKVRDSGLHTLYKTTEDGVNGYRALFINMCFNKYDLTYRESMFEVEFYGNGLDKTNESGKVGLYMGILQPTTTDPDVPEHTPGIMVLNCSLRCLTTRMPVNGGILRIINM